MILEGGVSHGGNVDIALRLAKAAADAGASAFKLQHYHADDFISKQDQEWHERMRRKQLTDGEIIRVARACENFGITFLCTAHTLPAFEFLRFTVRVPAFKVGSGEIGNASFINRICSVGRPVLVSTGMYSETNIKQLIKQLEEGSVSHHIALLHCTTLYPAGPETINLRYIERMRNFFRGPIGYSDHSEGPEVSLAAVALGASIIEKHIVPEEATEGQDRFCALRPRQLAGFVKAIHRVKASLGSSLKPKTLTETEKHSRMWAGKSLVAKRKISPGEVVNSTMLGALRPGTGIPVAKLYTLIGAKAVREIPEGKLLDKYDFETSYCLPHAEH